MTSSRGTVVFGNFVVRIRKVLLFFLLFFLQSFIFSVRVSVRLRVRIVVTYRF